MNKVITIRPSIFYWAISASPLFLLGMLCLSGYLLFLNYLAVKLLTFVLLLYILFFEFYNFVKYIYFTKWEISEEQILIYEGVFIRRVDFIELYRVTDYKIITKFFESLLGLHNFYIYSGDKTRPVLHIFGVTDKEIIKEIRTRVELQRTTKNIRELTNINM